MSKNKTRLEVIEKYEVLEICHNIKNRFYYNQTKERL